MKRVFKTMTYGDLSLRLKISQSVFTKSIDVYGEVDLETGEVTFKVSEQDLQKIKEQIAKDEKR